ncbi:hypothetical protein [Streptomyces lushanensis]|uniref:hypothetical protein n=1 Tax=Streptomyces lushanensis TaxID=1434255 RepID=UPI000836E51F|nr:hypothetical protein [Streptomyces lushanensis]
MTDNGIRTLNFSGQRIEARAVTGAKEFRIEGTAIVVNIGMTPAPVGELPRKDIPPLSSVILRDTSVERADSLIVLSAPEGYGDGSGDISGIVGEPGWKPLSDLLDGFPEDTPLWKSPQDDAGQVSFVPEEVLGRPEPGGTVRDFQVKVNLWFAPAGTDCRIHNLHEFLEVHTQVSGLGRMQKFREQDHGTLFEDVPMGVGSTHSAFCVTGPGSAFTYPWHQYRADTDCVWLAVEYHEIRAEEEREQS